MSQPEQRFSAPPILYESVVLFGEDTSKAVVDIHYRISSEFFIFVRSEAAPQRPEYVARGELAVELLDEQKNSVAREIRQISLSRLSPVKENDEMPDLQGAFSFAVPSGTYTIVFGLDDRESGRSFLERNRRVTATVAKRQPLELSAPILVQAAQAGRSVENVQPVNRGGSVLFGGNGGIICQVFQPESLKTLAVHWTLKGQLDGIGPRDQELRGTDYVLRDGSLRLARTEDGISYKVAPSRFRWVACYIPLPVRELEPGSFKLDVVYSSGSTSQAQSLNFRVVWRAKPFSLLNPELAVDALRHIATEDELGTMQSGSPTQRAQAFHGFWRARDRDTSTAYNEVMAEYYYRVDEALRKFSTVREGDGYKTDRGRIYILYGPPSQTDRILQPGGSPTEIWTYSHLRRRFVFIDPNKNGNFVLSQTENL